MPRDIISKSLSTVYSLIHMFVLAKYLPVTSEGTVWPLTTVVFYIVVGNSEIIDPTIIAQNATQ